jgi:cell division protein FtsN
LAKNEEGEFELVLGNRQLISVFLIVVILLAVFFSMGYIVGRNSAPGTATETARNTGSSAPEAPQKASPNSPPASQETPAAPAAEAPTTTHAEQPAATHGETPAATHAEQPAPTRPKPEAASPAPAAKPKVEPPAERVAAAGELGPGEYWQVVATARPDAEIIAEALTKKGFHALVSPAPKEGVYRVLVGPLKDAPAQAQTRTELEAAGFKNPLMRKY